VLDYLSILIQSEYINAGVLMIAGPFLTAVKHDQISLCYRAYEVNLFPRPFFRHFLKVGNECRLTVADQWIVLYVFITHILFYRFFRLAIVKRQGVKRHGVLLVSGQPFT